LSASWPDRLNINWCLKHVHPTLLHTPVLSLTCSCQ
jgi:hypothetical protein